MLILLALLACADTNTDTGADTNALTQDSGLPDADGDGWDSSWDCDDQDAKVNPDAVEICDGVDNDCDGNVDEGVMLEFYIDADLDGHGDPELPVTACALEAGLSELDDDCDDAEPMANPSLTEICNDLIDNDCDGTSNDCAPKGRIGTQDALFGVTSSEENDVLGWEAIGCPDLDGDGLGEVLIGALYGGRGSFRNSGAAYLIRGNPEGVQDITSAAHVMLSSTKPRDFLGTAMVGGMDMNGDGQADWAVGAPGDITSHSGTTLDDAGEVMLFSGELNGSLNARDDAFARIVGHQPGMHSGYSLAMASGALLVGAHQAHGKYELTGAAYLLMGPLEGELSLDDADAVLMGDVEHGQMGVAIGLHDLDGDGVPELMAAAPGTFWDDDAEWEPRQGSVTWLTGPASGMVSASSADGQLLGENDDMLGYAFSVGDVDGDGYADLAVGAYQASAGLGMVYLFSGPISSDLTLGDAVATVQGEGANEESGSSLDISQDLDGDGKADLLMGAWGWPEGEAVGRGYLLPGPLEGDLKAADARAIWGDTDGVAAMGFPIHYVPDLTGDQIPEIVMGASYFDSVTPYGGAVWVFQGAGL